MGIEYIKYFWIFSITVLIVNMILRIFTTSKPKIGFRLSVAVVGTGVMAFVSSLSIFVLSIYLKLCVGYILAGISYFVLTGVILGLSVWKAIKK